MDALAAQRPQAFLWCPVFMGIGIITYFNLDTEPSFTLSLAAALLPLIFLLFAWGQDRLRYVAIFLLCLGLGFCMAKMRTADVYTPILKKKLGPVDVSGTIHMVEHLSEEGGVRVVLKDVSIEDLPPENTPKKVRVKFRSEVDLHVGQRIDILAGLNPPSAPVIPGGFDFQRYMFFQSIGAVGFSYGAPKHVEDTAASGFHIWLQDLRSSIVTQLSEKEGKAGAVAGALMVGHKAGIAEEDRDAMRHAGLAHMLAISGLHIGLFFGAVFFTVRLFLAAFPTLTLKYPIKKYAAVLAMMGAVFYMSIAGATIPTQRAVLMTGAVFLAILMDRTPISMRLVAFAAMVILLIAPESVMSASFQMSFSAVASLVWFYSAIRPWWSQMHRKAGFWRRAWLYVLGVSLTTIIATIATAPFSLFHFQQLAVYSLLSNILAMPLLGFVVMPFAVLYFALLPLGFEAITLPIIGWGIEAILDIAHFTADLKYAVWHCALWPGSLLAVLCASFIMFLLVKGRLKVIAVLPFIIFMIGIFNIKQADTLVSSTADLIAVADQNGSLSVSNLQKERFVREQWMQSYGLEGKKPSKWPKEGQAGDLTCGEAGCRLQRAEHKISILRSPTDFEEECGWADVLISSDPLPKCDQADVIDRFTVYRHGAHAIYLGDDIEIKATEDARGKRPWVAKAQN